MLRRHWLHSDPFTILKCISMKNDICLMEKITFFLRLQKSTVLNAGLFVCNPHMSC